jgi:hypothetical protein
MNRMIATNIVILNALILRVMLLVHLAEEVVEGIFLVLLVGGEFGEGVMGMAL